MSCLLVRREFPGLSVDGQRRVGGDEVLVAQFVPEVVGDRGVQRGVVFGDALRLAGAGNDCGRGGGGKPELNPLSLDWGVLPLCDSADAPPLTAITPSST